MRCTCMFSHPASTPKTYTLSLHDALPIYYHGNWHDLCRGPHFATTAPVGDAFKLTKLAGAYWRGDAKNRSEEHTSELQSHVKLVCRLLLEKKKRSRLRLPQPRGSTWSALT